MRILVPGSVRLVARLHGGDPHVGLLTTPRSGHARATLEASGLPVAIDNGAFSGFDPAAFVRYLGRLEGLASVLWVACPDVVGDSAGTLRLWPLWAWVIRARGFEPAFVLQDGQETSTLPDARAYFVGGSDRWRFGPGCRELAAEAKRRGALLHVGRVNTLRRLRAAHDLGADTVDGSAYSRFGVRGYLGRSLRFLRGLEGEQTLF